MSTYYNDSDPYVAQWLRNLIKAGHLPDGEVDERSIVEVQPGDVAAFTHCHFFAGIGGWAYAMRLAGWPEERPLWTGSFPCQDISAASAGRATGLNGTRSGLWHEFYRLIAARRPPVVGIENSPRLRLLGADRIFTDLEKADYAWWSGVVGAEHVQAPHRRGRVWILAYANGARRIERTGACSNGAGRNEFANGTRSFVRSYADGAGLWEQPWRRSGTNGQMAPFPAHDPDADGENESGFTQHGEVGRTLGLPGDPDRQGLAVGESVGSYARAQLQALERAVGEGGYQWNGRPDRHFHVAYGLPAGMARSCTSAGGNAIVSQVAAEILKAWLAVAP